VALRGRGEPRRQATHPRSRRRGGARFCERRVTPECRADLEPLGTDWREPFLEAAPFLVVVFSLDYEPEVLPAAAGPSQELQLQESVGIASGLLIAALHLAGLATLTHTPSPMGFPNECLDRPRHERPFLRIPVGYPAPGARVRPLRRKGLHEIRIRV
jgi:hypothetical protein